jgi:hypothetical protein
MLRRLDHEDSFTDSASCVVGTYGCSLRIQIHPPQLKSTSSLGALTQTSSRWWQKMPQLEPLHEEGLQRAE